MVFQIPVKRRARHPQRLAHLVNGNGFLFIELSGQLQLSLITQGRFRSSSFAAPGSGSSEACICPLLDDVPLKLSKSPKDMENEFPAAGGGIDLLGQALKADLMTMQLGDPLDEVFERAAKPVKPPDDKRIPLPDVGKRLGKTLALGLCPAYCVGEDFEAAGSV